jgi:hypothetical protein
MAGGFGEVRLKKSAGMPKKFENRRTALTRLLRLGGLMAAGDLGAFAKPPAVAESGLDSETAGKILEIKNVGLRVQYDPSCGTWRCWTAGGKDLLMDVQTTAFTSLGVGCTGDDAAQRSASVQKVKTEWGEIAEIRTVTDFPSLRLRLEQSIGLLSSDSGILYQSRLTNLHDHAIQLDRIMDVEATGPATTEERLVPRSVLTDGFTSAGTSALTRLERDKTVGSFGTVAINSPSIVGGYFSGTQALGTFEVDLDTWKPWAGLKFRAVSRFDGVVMAPGETRSSDPLYLGFPEDPILGLEHYAALVREKNHVRLWNKPYTTWCSWYARYGRLMKTERTSLEESTLANARLLVSDHLKELGMDAVRIVDDGDQYGDWNFPSVPGGMGAAARQIHDLGIRAGVWVAPAFVSETSRLFHNHPDWLQRNTDGSLLVRRNYIGNTMYFLDPSHPGALETLRTLFTRIRQWGYDYVQADFLRELVWGDKFHDSTLTKVQIYRRALQTMRDALGPDVYLLGCNALILPSVGLVDGMRITNDTWGKDVRCPEAMAARWFMHNNFWLNDPDAILTRDLSVPQVQAWATLMAVTGGVQTLGDNLLYIDPGRLEVIKKIHPILGEAGRPLDLFERAQSSTWDLPLKTSFGKWHLLALFNWAQEPPQHFNLDLPSILNSPGPFLVFDFWNDKFLGEFAKSLDVDVPYWNTRALSVRNTTGSPQLLSTSNHITQGKVGLRDLHWDGARNILSGVNDALTREPFVLTLHVPQGFVPINSHAQGGSCDLAEQSADIWKLRLEPREGKIQWTVQFRKG